MHIQGKTAFVTGAAQGLGKAFSEALLARGANVCFIDVQDLKGKEVERKLQTTYGKDKVLFLQCDVSSAENIERVFTEAVDKFGHIDLVVNNAGVSHELLGRLMVDINLNGVIKGTQCAIDHMRMDKGGKGGVVVNIASKAGLLPFYLAPIYTATKHGVVGFTRSWASTPHIDDLGIQFACLCPGFTETAMTDVSSLGISHEIATELTDMMEQNGGVGKVEDVVEGFLMLIEAENCNHDVMTVVKGEGPVYKIKNGNPISPDSA